MEQEQDTPWTRSTEHINIQKRGNGQQTQRLEHPNSTQLMDHCLRTMSQVDMSSHGFLKGTAPSSIQAKGESLKTRVLKQWKLFNKQG
ncbi:PB1-F2 protein [Influenza A virus]